MDLALIGNCAYQALLDTSARVRWLCWPRFDSSFVFGSLVDDDRGGEFSILPGTDHGYHSEQAYLPLTNIVRTRIESGVDAYEIVDFAPRFLQYERSFKPTMLVRRVRRLAGTPSVRVVCRPVYDYGRLEPSSYVASNHMDWLIPGARLRLTTNAPLTYVADGRAFALEEDLYFVLTWGEPLEAPLIETAESFLARTTRYWRTWVKHARIPERYQEEVLRSALALKLHQFEDTGAITAAATTSLPEFPRSGRNWDYRFCWLRDSCFTLGALRRLGHFEEMERFMTYLHNIAEASPNHLQPVYGISGEATLTEIELEHLAGYDGDGPVRAGNAAFAQVQHDVYGEMIAAIYPLFTDIRFGSSTGERSTALMHSLLDSVERTLEAPDAGLWEKRADPKLHTFTLLMHWVGAGAAERVGRYLNDGALARQAAGLATRASVMIEEQTWRQDLGYYADSPTSSDADASLLMLVNLGFLSPDHPRAATHVKSLARMLGPAEHLLHRYVHDDGIGETHATFTVCGFWYAEALARLGHMDDAERVFAALLGHANHVGLFSEDIDPATGAQWGNFPQTYSHVGLINSAFLLAPPKGPVL